MWPIVGSMHVFDGIRKPVTLLLWSAVLCTSHAKACTSNVKPRMFVLIILICIGASFVIDSYLFTIQWSRSVLVWILSSGLISLARAYEYESTRGSLKNLKYTFSPLCPQIIYFMEFTRQIEKSLLSSKLDGNVAFTIRGIFTFLLEISAATLMDMFNLLSCRNCHGWHHFS